MGLFDKKYCDVCGEKIGLFGNRKLENGNLCKECAKKLSPWFDDRRHSTVEQIKDQLAYRENNKAVLAAFNATKVIGSNCPLLYIDEAKRQFLVAKKIDDGNNHDVINLSQVTSCYVDTEEHRIEEMRTNKDGEKVSYNPPRYKYLYDYYVYIMINSPYFDEIKIKVNNLQVGETDQHSRHKVEKICREMVGYMTQVTGTGTGNDMNFRGAGMNGGFGNHGNTMGERLANHFFEQVEINRMKMEQQSMNQGQMNQQPVNQKPAGSWFCQNCGAQNSGKFCENCGTPRG